MALAYASREGTNINCVSPNRREMAEISSGIIIHL
jgi:hypothetical protein